MAHAAADRAPLEDARDGRVVLVDPRRRQLDAEDEDDRRADDDERAGSLTNCVCTSLGRPTARVVVGAVAAATRAPRTSFSQPRGCFTRRAEQPRNLTGAPACMKVHSRPPIARLRAAASQFLRPWRPSKRLPNFVPAESCPALSRRHIDERRAPHAAAATKRWPTEQSPRRN